jgi:hypothetical protein
MGIDYLYQPYFSQQLGIFSDDPLRPAEVNDFLAAIPMNYRYIDIHLNSGNSPSDSSFEYTFRRNCTLDLSRSFIQLGAAYHRNCNRNIRKAVHAGLTLGPGPGPADFTRFIKRHLHWKLSDLRNNFYDLLQQIVEISIQNGTGEILGIYTSGNSLAAAGWFVQASGRYTFLVCASTPEGRENQAMYLLVDRAIREKAGSNLLFDFAGSNIPGILYFNRGFGATESLYPVIKRNNLPWPVKMFKR